MNSDELSGHFDTHKDPLKWFHPDFPFYHVTKTSKKGWSGRFRTNSTMPMFFYAHDNPKNTSSVQPWATLRDFVSSVMLAEFYLYISKYTINSLSGLYTLGDTISLYEQPKLVWTLTASTFPETLFDMQKWHMQLLRVYNVHCTYGPTSIFLQKDRILPVWVFLLEMNS